jgi:hypothetical protein
MKYAFEMGSGVMIYTSRRSKVDRGDSETHRLHGDNISLLLFLQNEESRLEPTAIFQSEN